MSGARTRALSEIDRAKVDAYAARVMAGHDNPGDPLRTEVFDEWRLVAEGHGRSPRGRTPGERFTASGTYAEWVAGGDEVLEPVVVAEAHELVQMAATVSFPDHPIATSDLGAVKPRFSPLDLVTVIPVTAQRVRGTALTADAEPANLAVPWGTASTELVINADDTDDPLTRFPLHANVHRSTLADHEAARRLIDQELTRVWFRTLALQVIVGDGVDPNLLGILETAGIGSVAATGTATAALLAAVRTVMNAGWPGPHVAIFNPTDLEALLGEAEWRQDRFPTLTVVGFDRLTAGTAVVGQAGAGRLFSDGLSVGSSVDHASNLLEGKVTLQAEAGVRTSTPHADAFCEITAL